MASEAHVPASALEEKARKIADLPEVSSNTFDYVIVGKTRPRNLLIVRSQLPNT